MNDSPMKLIIVTPAGRRAYLDLLKHYILRDVHVDEWHLWDNCRDPADRTYIQQLAAAHPKIKIVVTDHADGTNLSVNRFYKNCHDPEAFYIKIDDDVVYIQDGTFQRVLDDALKTRGQYLWWSPLVINNALCSYLLKHNPTPLEIVPMLTAQAACPVGWASPRFAKDLHAAFLACLQNKQTIRVNDVAVSLSRFSINCIGFFGTDVAQLGETFCPPNTDDEEWITATLPLLTGRCGKIVGQACVSHYSFFTQENELNDSPILDEYYKLAGLTRQFPLPAKRKLPKAYRTRSALRVWLDRQLLNAKLKPSKPPMVRLRSSTHPAQPSWNP